MGIFSNASFNKSFKYDDYPSNPIHLDMNTNVYVEVKGRRGIFVYRSTTILVFLFSLWTIKTIKLRIDIWYVTDH